MTMHLPGAKRCFLCRVVRPVREFHRQAASRDGLQSYCRECAREYRRANRGRTGWRVVRLRSAPVPAPLPDALTKGKEGLPRLLEEELPEVPPRALAW
jgi:hypothetical protein